MRDENGRGSTAFSVFKAGENTATVLQVEAGSIKRAAWPGGIGGKETGEEKGGVVCCPAWRDDGRKK